VTKTPAPVAAANRDPSSVLPTIPVPRKEPSGAFPLPGMAPPEGAKAAGENDVTLIARLSILDEPSEESTKVEQEEAAVLRAKASTETADLTDTKFDEDLHDAVDLGEQAAVEREKALAAGAASPVAARLSAAEFEDPGDDDEDVVVSATPGIISIEEDEEEPTASQRPSGRNTPAPVIPSLGSPTPPPMMASPRLPAPTPVPGRTMKLPTPGSGLATLGAGRWARRRRAPRRRRSRFRPRRERRTRR
jgi:hypothetical protein